MYNNVSEELKDIVTNRKVLSCGAKLTFKKDLDTLVINGNIEQGENPTPTSPKKIKTLKSANISSLESMSTINGGYVNNSTGVIGKVKAGIEYTLKFKNNSSYNNNITARLANDTATQVLENLSSKNLIPDGITTYTFTPSQNGSITLSGKLPMDMAEVFTEFMLYEGIDDKPYIPYGYIRLDNYTEETNKSTLINIGDNELLTEDYIEIDKIGSVKLYKEYKKVVLKDFFSDAGFNAGSKVIYKPIADRDSDILKAFCTISKLNINASERKDWQLLKEGEFCNYLATGGTTAPYIFMKVPYSSKNEFLESLNGSEEYIYPLAEIIEIDLEKVKPLHIFVGKNDFKVIASLEPSSIIANYLNEDLTITNSELSSLNLQDDCYYEGNILGNNIAKDLEVTILNKNQYDLENREFKLELGIKLDNGIYEYVPYGNFIIDTAEDLKSNYQFKLKAMDYLVKFNSIFEDTNVYPITLKAFRHYVADFYNIDEVEQTLPNDSFIIQEKPYFDNMSGREVIKAIAQLNGCFVKINRFNELEYIPLKNTSSNVEVIGANKMNSMLEIDKMYGEINVVALSLGGDTTGENVTRRDEESILQYGEHPIEIIDNPFVDSEERRERAIDNLFNSLKGFKYVPTSFNYTGRFWLDTGDNLSVQDTTNLNNYHSSMLLKHHIQVPQIRQSKIENEALTEKAIENQYVSNIERKIGRTELRVDKQNKQITAIIEEQQEDGEKIVNIEANLDGIRQSVTSSSNSIASLNATTDKLNNDISNVKTTLTSEVEQLSNSLTAQISRINTTIQDGVSASSVVTTSGRFDENGLTIARSDSEFEANFNNVGMYVNKGNTNMLTADKDGVITENLTVRTYFKSGYHRTEGYLDENFKKRTGTFYVG